jgi:nucleoside-diphosphate-sugar epimerase
MMGYRASKTFAENAAWEFVKNEEPNFTISTINPPMVFGPIVSCRRHIQTLSLTEHRYTL